jgi:hypothetical protein
MQCFNQKRNGNENHEGRLENKITGIDCWFFLDQNEFGQVEMCLVVAMVSSGMNLDL